MLILLQNNSIFGMVLTLMAFGISYTIYKKYKMTLLQPTVVTVVILILLLLYLGIDYDDYFQNGGDIIHFFLGPATVALTIPLFRQWKILKSNAVSIVIGILVGSFTGIISMFFLSKAFGLDEVINSSLLAKSVTTPIAVNITEFIGGIPPITVLGVISAGSIGAIFGPKVLKITGVKNEVAKGIAMGTAAHGFGTVRALEEGEVQGAMAGLSIGLTGLATALIIPFVLQLLGV